MQPRGNPYYGMLCHYHTTVTFNKQLLLAARRLKTAHWWLSSFCFSCSPRKSLCSQTKNQPLATRTPQVRCTTFRPKLQAEDTSTLLQSILAANTLYPWRLLSEIQWHWQHHHNSKWHSTIATKFVWFTTVIGELLGTIWCQSLLWLFLRWPQAAPRHFQIPTAVPGSRTHHQS